MEINELAKEIHDNALEHGWWDEPRSYHVISGLFHSEVVEAVEADRKNEEFIWYNGKKPDGIAIELADCVIRILDYFVRENVDAEKQINSSHLNRENKKALELNIDEFADYLHNEISKASFLANPDNSNWIKVCHLSICVKMIDEWLKMRRYDMKELIKIKHEYNKTRPYKHGKKY